MVLKRSRFEHPASSPPVPSRAIPSLPTASRDASRFLTALEAAAYLGISRNTVSRLVQRGELAGRRIGGRYFIPRAALEALEQGDTA